MSPHENGLAGEPQVAHNLAFEATYVGSHSTHLILGGSLSNMNTLAPKGGLGFAVGLYSQQAWDRRGTLLRAYGSSASLAWPHRTSLR